MEKKNTHFKIPQNPKQIQHYIRCKIVAKKTPQQFSKKKNGGNDSYILIRAFFKKKQREELADWKQRVFFFSKKNCTAWWKKISFYSQKNQKKTKKHPQQTHAVSKKSNFPLNRFLFPFPFCLPILHRRARSWLLPIPNEFLKMEYCTIRMAKRQ